MSRAPSHAAVTTAARRCARPGRGWLTQPEGVGNVYEWRFSTLGMRFTGVTVYTEYVPGERMSWRDIGAIENANTWTFTPEGDGTRATLYVNARARVPLLGRLLEPLLMRQMDKMLRAGLAEVEAQAARAAVPA